jgi:uncharacterized protein YecE (DUF72 family)
LNAAPNIAVGLAGWSYPDWKGYVYPPGIKDPLRFVAGYVDMIEVNSTFYRIPSEKTVASWVDRVGDLPEFFFSAKLPQEITHKGELSPALVTAFRRALTPLVMAGRLRHLLAQFRWDFTDTPANRSYLGLIRKHLGEMSNLTLELRDRSWQAPEAMAYLDGLEVTVANLDYPLGRQSFNVPLCNIGRHAYLRLHGRNTAAWFSKDAGRDQTYNYLYNRQEVDSIRTRALELARMSTSLTLVANNHYRGKEMVNAIQLKSLFLGHKVLAPSGLIAQYPELGDYADNRT